MDKIKNIFGGIKLTYKKLIIVSIFIGILVGILNSIPIFYDTTITDIASIYGFWIFCGIFIIMNSKSNLDSAIKCFLFFLISQPLIYLVEVPFNTLGFGLFKYYPFWFKLTLLCFPMGYIGYYLKKDKWYGILILLPILILLDSEIMGSYQGIVYSFPHHLVNLIMVIFTSIIYPLVLFENKKIKYTCLIISILCIFFFGYIALTSNTDYETLIVCSSDTFYFDSTYKAYLKNNSFGDLSISKDNCIDAKFHKKGNTKLILEDSNGKKKEYEIIIGKNTYDLKNHN